MKKVKVLYIAGKINVSNGAYHSLLASIKKLKENGIVPTVIVPNHGAVEDGFRSENIECIMVPYPSCTVPADAPSKIKGILKKIQAFGAEKKIKKIIFPKSCTNRLTSYNVHFLTLISQWDCI